jgi:hypothetical protein
MESSTVTDGCPRFEGPEVQVLDVEHLGHFRVGGEKNLKPSVEEEAVDVIGADSPPNTVGRFKDSDGSPGLMEVHGGGESCKAGANNHNIDVLVVAHRLYGVHR